MLLEAKIEEGIITVEYDKAGENALIKAGILSGIFHAIDSDRIGQLEKEVERLKKRNRKLRRKLQDASK